MHKGLAVVAALISVNKHTPIIIIFLFNSIMALPSFYNFVYFGYFLLYVFSVRLIFPAGVPQLAYFGG
jgi:hypothetical protein